MRTYESLLLDGPKLPQLNYNLVGRLDHLCCNAREFITALSTQSSRDLCQRAFRFDRSGTAEMFGMISACACLPKMVGALKNMIFQFAKHIPHRSNSVAFVQSKAPLKIHSRDVDVAQCWDRGKDTFHFNFAAGNGALLAGVNTDRGAGDLHAAPQTSPCWTWARSGARRCAPLFLRAA